MLNLALVQLVLCCTQCCHCIPLCRTPKKEKKPKGFGEKDSSSSSSSDDDKKKKKKEKKEKKKEDEKKKEKEKFVQTQMAENISDATGQPINQEQALVDKMGDPAPAQQQQMQMVDYSSNMTAQPIYGTASVDKSGNPVFIMQQPNGQ